WGSRSNPLLLSLLVLSLPVQCSLRTWSSVAALDTLPASPVSRLEASLDTDNLHGAADSRLYRHPSLGADTHAVPATLPRVLRSVTLRHRLRQLRRVQLPAGIVAALPPFRAPPGATPRIELGDEYRKT